MVVTTSLLRQKCRLIKSKSAKLEESTAVPTIHIIFEAPKVFRSLHSVWLIINHPQYKLTIGKKRKEKSSLSVPKKMSNRYANRQDGNKGFTKTTQKKFVPKNHNSAPKEPIPNPTLSSSLRQSLSKQPDAAAAAASKTTSRENRELVSGRAASGNFVNYLPQDEAVAAGLGPNEAGSDALLSQSVVDLLNRELSRLLKLNPRDFWREGNL